MNIIDFIPQTLRQKAIDATVDFVANFGKGYLKDEIVQKIKKLRSDGTFQEGFEKGLQQASNRFIEEYINEDEDLVEAITSDKKFFENEEVQKALLAILKKPGLYLAEEQEVVVKSFDSILPNRRNRQRVNNAVHFFLKCLAEEVWHLPELRPVYEFQFQRMTAEAFREQVALQKAQLQANLAISTDVRDALLQLTGAIAEQKALPSGEELQTSSPKVFHNLPQPDYERFIGRETELNQIRKLLYPTTRHFVVTIDGIGGIGKSALALEIADSYRRQFDKLPEDERFEAIIWITAKHNILTGEGIIPRIQSLRTLKDIYTTIAVILQRKDILNAPLDEQDDFICQALTQQRTLLVIDNLETVDDEQVLTFIRDVPEPTKVIVTTRHRIDIAYPVRLVAMPENEAVQLIHDTAEQKSVTITPNESKQLYQRTGGVPLAIVWSVAKMSFGYSMENVLIRLGEPTGDIAQFCFKIAIESIETKPAYTLLLVLSMFATDASREALGKIADIPELDRDDGLVMLEKLSLVDKYSGRFSLLPLTRDFVTNLLKKDTANENSLRMAFIQYFQEFCQKFGGDQWRMYHYLDADLKNVQLAIEYAYQLEMWAEVGELASNLMGFLDKRNLWNEMIEYADMAIEVGKEINDKRLIAQHKIFALGWVKAVRFRNFDEGLASVREGKNIAQEIGDEYHYLIALRNEGHILQKQGEYAKAQKLLEENLALWQKRGDTVWEVRTLGALAANQRDIGNLDSATVYCRQALEKAKEVGHTDLTALNFQRLGNILWQQGQFEKAYSHAKEALKIYQQLKMKYDGALSLLLLAKSEYSLSKIQEAREHADEAYGIFLKVGRKDRLKQTKDLLEALIYSPDSPSEYLANMGVQGY